MTETTGSLTAASRSTPARCLATAGRAARACWPPALAATLSGVTLVLLRSVLLFGAALAVLLGGLILGSLVWNPRIWLQNAPRRVREAVPPKSPREKAQTAAVAVPFVILVAAVPLLAVIWTVSAAGRPLGYFEALVVCWGVLMVFNVADLLVIDWLIVCRHAPPFLIPVGAEHLRDDYRSLGRHAKGFLAGIVILFAVSLLLAAAAMLL
jgi:hypothetical protein